MISKEVNNGDPACCEFVLAAAGSPEISSHRQKPPNCYLNDAHSRMGGGWCSCEPGWSTGVKEFLRKYHSREIGTIKCSVPDPDDKAAVLAPAPAPAQAARHEATTQVDVGQASADSQPKTIYTDNWCACSHIAKQHKCGSCKPLPRISVPPSLYGKAILLLGDSLPWQMAQTLKCVVGSKMDIVFKGMHLFPIDETRFEATLNEMIKTQEYAAVVLGIGTWYNWEWGMPVTNPVTASTSTRLLMEACPLSLRAYLEGSPYSSSTDPYARALRIRKECKAMLGQEAYQSGLERLRTILSRRRGEWPPVFWKDVPPQHWNTPSGQYDWGGVGGACVPLGNATLAYERNNLADQALRMNGHFIRAWAHDANRSGEHVGGDCTHYCNPSSVTLNWANATLTAVANSVARLK